MKRPRGGEQWKNKDDGTIVIVQWRRSVNPMDGIRPDLNKDAWWSIVLLDNWQTLHESDFVTQYEFVKRIYFGR